MSGRRPYMSPLRRVLRRIVVNRFQLIRLLYVPVTAAFLLWFWRDSLLHPWYGVSRWLAFLVFLALALLMTAASLFVKAASKTFGRRGVPNPQWHIVSAASAWLSAVSLAAGRTDIAAIATYLPITRIWPSNPYRSANQLPAGLVRLGIALGFALHIPWLPLAGIAVLPMLKWLSLPPITTLVREKPLLAEWVEDQRRSCSVGGG